MIQVIGCVLILIGQVCFLVMNIVVLVDIVNIIIADMFALEIGLLQVQHMNIVAQMVELCWEVLAYWEHIMEIKNLMLVLIIVVKEHFIMVSVIN